MRTRTRLTTPPGQEPVDEVDDRGPERERYTRGLDLPTEPAVPSRLQRPVAVIATLVVLVALGFIAFRLSSAGQYEDPALSDAPGQDVPVQDEADPPGGDTGS